MKTQRKQYILTDGEIIVGTAFMTDEQLADARRAIEAKREGYLDKPDGEDGYLDWIEWRAWMAAITDNNFATKADIDRLKMLIDSLVVGVIVTAIRV
jgi:hypothetical protein